jgi:3-oxoacyl-[acyl-carrier-protein] synthase II
MVIGDALDAVRLGCPELMLCGGTDAAIARTRIASFAAMRALSRRTDDPRQQVGRSTPTAKGS